MSPPATGRSSSARQPLAGPPAGVLGTPVLVVTGTGTGIGKTVVTAAVAVLAVGADRQVAVVKPAQTGVRAGEPGDLETVHRLTGIGDLHEFARYPDPLSPEAAARRSGQPALALADCARRIDALRRSRDLVLVEGAGGLLVRFHPSGWTLADLAQLLDAAVLLVTRAGLGTLNETALTVEALQHRNLTPAGLVIGAWPARPGLAARSNVADLETLTGRPLAGALRSGAGRLPAHAFRPAARGGLAPQWGGEFDAADFRRAALGRRGGRDGAGG